MRKLKNVLVEYQGGGYDGCFWEWNYAFIDSYGKFHSIFASGSKGCTTLEEMKDYMSAADANPSRHGNSYGLYKINNKAEMERFADTAPIDRMITVARWFSYNQFKRVAIEPKCSACGCRFNALGGSPEGLQGEGGIVLSHREIVCEDCYSQHSCPDCNEYYGPDYKGWKDDEDDGRACEWCAERRAERESKATATV